MMTWCEIAVVYLVATFIVVNGCSHGTTMMMKNPGAYTAVFATTNEKICTTSWSEHKTHVFISDCETDDDIVVMFDDLNNTLETGGSDTGERTVTIRCHHEFELIKPKFRKPPLDINIKSFDVLHPAVSESASIESECLWLFMVWLALKIF